MALRKQGNVWYIRYRKGTKVKEKSTGCTNKDDALVIERNFMKKLRLERMAKRLGFDIGQILPPTVTDGRTRLVDMVEIASKYRDLKKEHRMYWTKFCNECGCRFADEVTVKVAIDFLSVFNNKSAKTYNNCKTCLNTVFSLCVSETGIESPFAKIMPKINKDKKDHRCFTADELERLLATASPFWRFMVILAKETGMPKESCLRFCPAMIVVKDGVPWVKYLRAKTSRFGRYCQVPLRKTVIDMVAPLMEGRKPDEPFVNAFNHSTNADHLSNQFSEMLKKLGIRDTEEGIIDFHSLRSNFVTMCDEMGIQRHATNGMVGHVQDNVTDLYSHDEITPLQIVDYDKHKAENVRAFVGCPVGGR